MSTALQSLRLPLVKIRRANQRGQGLARGHTARGQAGASPSPLYSASSTQYLGNRSTGEDILEGQGKGQMDLGRVVLSTFWPHATRAWHGSGNVTTAWNAFFGSSLPYPQVYLAPQTSGDEANRRSLPTSRWKVTLQDWEEGPAVSS
jgi:hypothetical protein